MAEMFSVRHFEEADIPLLTSGNFSIYTRKEAKSYIKEIKKIIGKEVIFLINEGCDSVLCGFFGTGRSTNQTKIWIRHNNGNARIILKAISFLLYEGFYIRKFHKISILIPNSDYVLIKAINDSKWQQEGTLADHYYIEDKYVDGLSYVILEKDFYNFSTSMVPFLTGYLMIQTTNSAVFSISIFKKGDLMPLFIYDNVEYCKTICDSDKKIKIPENYEQIKISESAYKYLFDSSKQLLDYINGKRTKFDMEYEYSDATRFQKQVWGKTNNIPFGQTCSYEDIAKQISAEDKEINIKLLSRAVGTALSKNPIMIVIPCHRVIGKDGKLKGFAGGLEVKDYLLSHEMLFRSQ